MAAHNKLLATDDDPYADLIKRYGRKDEDRGFFSSVAKTIGFGDEDEPAPKTVPAQQDDDDPYAALIEKYKKKDGDGAFMRGVHNATNSAAMTSALAAGQYGKVAELVSEDARYRKDNPSSPESDKLMAAWKRDDTPAPGGDESVLDQLTRTGGDIGEGVSNVAGQFVQDWRAAPDTATAIGATAANANALREGIVGQLPNMMAPMGGMLAGGAVGAAGGSAVPLVGTTVGGLTGAWAGGSLGTALVEGGQKVQEALQEAGIDPSNTAAVRAFVDKNRNDILLKTGIKSATIGAVDTLTLKMGHILLAGPAQKAVERALSGMGVDATNKAAVAAAKKTPEFAAKIAADSTYRAATQGVQKARRIGSAAALEPLGEGVGELVGEGLATDEWDAKEAALEAASSIGQSAATHVGQRAYVAATSPFKSKGGPSGEDIQAEQPAYTEYARHPDGSGDRVRVPIEPEQSTSALVVPGTEVSPSPQGSPADIGVEGQVREIDARLTELQERQAELATDNGYGPMFDGERNEVAGELAALQGERSELTKDWPAMQAGAPTTFSTEAGNQIAASFALIEAGDLVSSHDDSFRVNPNYPAELQPRDRERAASEVQIADIVRRFDPNRLGLSAESSAGAPIIGPDGYVESGNGRTIVLRRIYQANGQKAADYRQFIHDNAQQFGLDPQQVAAMDKPVLVRVRATPVDRAEFAHQSNVPTVAQMGPSEVAMSDAKRLGSISGLYPDDNGDFNNAASRPFVRRFMSLLSVGEQAGMVDAEGRLSTAGHARIRNAVLARAYGNSPVLARMTESLDDNLRNVSKALLTVAPRVAAMREDISQGSVFDADITPDILEAVEEFSRIKEKGGSVEGALKQVGMFGERYSPEVRALLEMLDANTRSARRMASFLGAYIDALEKAGNPNQASLVDDAAPPTKMDLIGAALAATSQTESQSLPGLDAAQEASEAPAPVEPQAAPTPEAARPDTAPASPAPTTSDESPKAPVGPPKAADPTLPAPLAGAKPNYNFGAKAFTLDFESDIDKAAYIAARENPSKQDAQYVKFVSDATGMSTDEVRAHGGRVRDAIKAQAKDAQPGTLTVPKVSLQERAQSNQSGEESPSAVSGQSNDTVADQAAKSKDSNKAKAPVAKDFSGYEAALPSSAQSDGGAGSGTRMDTATLTPADGTASRKTGKTNIPEKPSEQKPLDKTAAKIDDFGEKIAGAKKDYAQTYKDKFAQGVESDIKDVPLSQSWPEPNYESLLAAGVDPWVVGFIRAAREEIPPKPRRSYKLAAWTGKVQALRSMAADIMEANSAAKIKELMALPEYERVSGSVGFRADMYADLGHEKSLAGFKLARGEYGLFAGVKYDPPKVVWTITKPSASSSMGNWPNQLAAADTREQAIDAFKKLYKSLGTPAQEKKGIDFSIYSYRGKPGFYIGKKVGKSHLDLKQFDTAQEARTYLEANHDDLVKALEKEKWVPNERRDLNLPRVGDDHRGGVDVTPEMFQEAFGFRGVQFGNYVEGSRRQEDLNNAYDALMDMAGILGVPSQALSLNGELGLAFGARGSGGKNPAKAHYEMDKVVINLTKNKGAGSLAHEWWHALDSYFSRRAGRSADMITESSGVASLAGGGKAAPTSVRREMLDAFATIVRAVQNNGMLERSRNLDKRRTKAYWSTTHEMTARAFESYIINRLQDQNHANDYLANIVDETDFALENAYPYPTAGEIKGIRAAFDGFFQAVQTRKTDVGTALESIDIGGPRRGISVRAGQQVVDRTVAGLPGSSNVGIHVVENRLSVDDIEGHLPSMGSEGIYSPAQRDAQGKAIPARIYLIASQLRSVARAEQVLAHELVGHFGMEALLGDKFSGVLADVIRLTKVPAGVILPNDGVGPGHPLYATMDAVQRDYPDYSQANQAREVLARMAETGVKPGFVDRVVGYIRKFLRAAGFRISYSTGEIKTMVVGAARQLQRATGDQSISGALSAAESLRAAEARRAASVPVSSVQGNEFGAPSEGIKALRDRAKEWGAQNLQGNKYRNAQTGWNIQVGRKGLRETISRSARIEKVQSIAALPDMLRDAVFSHSRPAKKDIDRSTKAFHTMYAPIRIGEDIRVARLLVREANNGEFFYDHDISGVSKEKTPEITSNAVPGSKPGRMGGNTRAELTIDQMRNIVNDEGRAGWVFEIPRDGLGLADPSANILESRATTAEDGTPDSKTPAQKKWLDVEARARGFKSIDDAQARNPKLAAKLEKLWQSNTKDGQALSASDRAENIISKRVATFKPFDTALRVSFEKTGVSKLISKVFDGAGFILNHPVLDRFGAETVRAGVISNYGIPEAVIDQRALLQGRQNVQLRQAGRLIDKLATLTRAESRIAYEWMNESSQDVIDGLMAQLPAESVAVLKEVQQMIDRLSREAVKLGQLSPEAYKRNQFAYLHRSYAKHMIEQGKGEKRNRSRVVAVLGNQYKGRGLTDAATMSQIRAIAPDWWKRKTQEGKADASLINQTFVRLERHAHSGEGTMSMDGIGDRSRGRLLEVAYYPTDDPLPAKYATDWTQAGVYTVRDVKGGKAILWRDFTKAEREKMGEIDEARFAIVKTLHGMIRDVETGRYFEWLAANHAAKPTQVIDPDKIMDATRNLLYTFEKDKWVQVPEVKIKGTDVLKYGALAGRFIPGPVWNDLRQMDQIQPLGNTYGTVLRWWKASKTALSPTVHMNNVMSNFIMADWHDVGAGHTLKALRILMAAHERDGKGLIGRSGNLAARAGIIDRAAAQEIMNRYTDSGGGIGTWATEDLARSQINPLLESLEQELTQSGETQEMKVGVFSALQHLMHLQFKSAFDALAKSKPSKAVGNEAKNMIALYQAEDDVFRLATWLKAKEEGKTDREAGKAARRSFLDYHINAPWISAARTTLIPFISYTYRAVPMILEIAKNKPHKLMKLMLVAGALNTLGVAMSGGDDDDERKLLPEEKAGNIWGLVPKLMRMPWNDDNESPVYLDVRRWVPAGDFFDTGQSHAAFPMLPAMEVGGPVALLFELIANKSTFTGQPITLETDTAKEKTAKVADHLYKSFAPNVLGLPGSWATSNLTDALNGRTDVFGREQSVAQVMASSFGIKLGSYPADVLRRNLGARTRAQIREIKTNIWRMERQLQTKRMSREEFSEKAKAQTDKIAELQNALRERLGR